MIGRLARNATDDIERFHDEAPNAGLSTTTPTPFAYSVLLNRTICICSFRCRSAPVGSIGQTMPVIVAFISYTLSFVLQ